MFEKLSLRVSAREVEVRISWPMEMVICCEGGGLVRVGEGENERGMGGGGGWGEG